jgi:phosphomannomutase
VRHEAFEVAISGLSSGEVESLRRDLARAAIRIKRRGDGDRLVVESRRNAVFSADDVLDVLANWIEKKPERLAAASVSVRRATRRNAVSRRMQTPAIEQRAAN